MNNLNGLMRVIVKTAASTGAANTSVNLQPDAGIIWRISVLWGYHAAGGARAAAWYWTDPETPAGATIGATIAALAANTALWFPGMAASGAASAEIAPHGPVFATYYSFPTFLWTATGAGENGYVKALVIQYQGQQKVG